MEPITLEELERRLDGGEEGRRLAAERLGVDGRLCWNGVTVTLVFDPEGPTLEQLLEDAGGPA